jgi:hypothetical protein
MSAVTITSMMKTAIFASQKVLRGIRPSKLPKNLIHFIGRRGARCGRRHGAVYRNLIQWFRITVKIFGLSVIFAENRHPPSDQVRGQAFFGITLQVAAVSA